MTFNFGVGEILAYQYSDVFEEDQIVDVEPGKIQFPCFQDEAFYLYLREYDTYQEDTSTQISVGCKDLQEGTN